MIFLVIGILNGAKYRVKLRCSIRRARLTLSDLIQFDNRFDSYKIVRVR